MVTKPPNDLGFSNSPDLSALAGCYQNEGESGKNTVSRLSGAIWSGTEIVHKDIDAIDVLVTENKTVRVRAIKSHLVVHEQIFVEGEDFTFRSGEISIPRSFVSTATEPGNVFLGAGIGSTTIGIDAKGDGRTVEAVTFGGAAFLIIPIAAGVKQIARFPRRPELCVLN